MMRLCGGDNVLDRELFDRTASVLRQRLSCGHVCSERGSGH